MSKFIGNLIWLAVSSAMGYMIYIDDFQYLNVITAYMIIILSISTFAVPVFWGIAAFAVESKDKDCEELIAHCGKGVNFFYLLFLLIKTLITVPLMAMSGYALILAWYVVMRALTCKFFLWCKEKSKEIKQ